MINSLVFYLSENVFISSSLLKNIFTGYRIRGWQFFSINSLKLLSYYFLASLVSDDCHSNYWFPTYNMLFSSDCFCACEGGGRIWFSSVWLWYVWAWTSSSLSCLGFTELYEPMSLCILQSFQTLLLQNLFSKLPSLFPPSEILMAWKLNFWHFTQFHGEGVDHFFFFPIFFLCGSN